MPGFGPGRLDDSFCFLFYKLLIPSVA